MPSVSYNCKICKKPGTAQFPEHAPQHAVDTWYPLLAHDRCADMIRAKRDSESFILSTCFRYHNMDEKVKEKQRDVIRRALEASTLKYAKALADIMHLPHYVWSVDFVSLLMEKPDKCGRILWDYREQLRKDKHTATEENAYDSRS